MKSACGGPEIINEIKKLYRSGQTDYFLEPIVLTDNNDDPMGLIRDGDAVIFCCRRGEREIQLTRAFVDPLFKEFPMYEFKNLLFISMTLYHEMFLNMPVKVAFPPLSQIKDNLGETISRSGLRQLRIAESEKFAHVTFFMNGGNNRPYPDEDDVSVPSPKGVPFEHLPELSAAEVAQETIKGICTGKYDFITANLANGDIIGHLENPEPKIKCAEAVDWQLGNILEHALAAGYVTIITADHGVLEQAIKPDGNPNVSHTHNPVPFAIIGPGIKKQTDPILREDGKLIDIAPTVLQIMGLLKPALMTGQSLLTNDASIPKKTKVLLIILDGWGIGKEDETNPIFMADTPVWDRLLRQHPFTSLNASGRAVGLLDWKPGNSEAGHMCIGAGREVPQDDVRISNAIEDGSFFQNPVFLDAIESVKTKNSSLHLISLLSQTSSHGSIDYPLALLRLAKEKLVKKAYVHVILDGRSTKVRNAPTLLKKLASDMEIIGLGQIASSVGRSFALDRNGNYQKTRKAYNALVFGLGLRIKCIQNK